MVNLAEYRQHLEGLKDELFTTLRKTESERREHEERARVPRKRGQRV